MAGYQLKTQRRNLGFIGGMSITLILIITNVILFILSSTVNTTFFENYLAIKPSLILQGKSLWTFVTSMFFHGGFFHLFANMFSLFFVGSFLEKIIGSKRFLKIYFVSGILGSLFFVLSGLIFDNLSVPAVGASGAIFGLLGVLAFLVPKSKIYLIAGPLILLILQFILMPIIPSEFIDLFLSTINILIILMIFAMFSFGTQFQKFAVPIKLSMWMLPIIAIIPLVLIDLVVDLPIGNSAHIGGLVAGLIYGYYLKQKFPRKTRELSYLYSEY
ncbi:MAG: rhomboid family intramembrane serine protease [Nanoarchaeota archaeon]